MYNDPILFPVSNPYYREPYATAQPQQQMDIGQLANTAQQVYSLFPSSGGAVSSASATVSPAASGGAAGSSQGGALLGGQGMGGLASFWPAAAIIGGIVNESEARRGGYRDSSDFGYFKDLLSGKVLEQDVEKRWAPKFGDDKLGFGADMRVAANLATLDPSGAWRAWREGSPVGKFFRKLF